MIVNYKYKWLLLFLILSFFCCYPTYSFAADTSILNSVVAEFKSKADSWANIVKRAADFLFFSLGTISLVWTLGSLFIKRVEIGELFGELIKFSVFFGFMYYILNNAPAIGSSIINSFEQLASQAGGSKETMTASKIVEVGYDIIAGASKKFSMWNLGESIVLGIMAIIILINVCIIAVSFVTLQITAYIVLNGGIFILGFGGAKWTSEIALNYYKTLIGIGLQLFTMILIVSIGSSIMTDYSAKMNGTISFENLSIMLLTSIFLLITSSKIPPIIGGMMTGATGSTSFGGAAMALAGIAASMATAAAAMGAAATSIAKVISANGVGGLQALNAAMQSGVGNDKSQDTTPDISNVDTSASSTPEGNNWSSDNRTSEYNSSNATKGDSGQAESGQDGMMGDNGRQGEPGQDGISKDDNPTNEQYKDATPGVKSQEQSSNGKSPLTEQPRSFGEKLKMATAAVGSQIASDIKAAPGHIKESVKQSINDFGSDSYMGKVAQKIQHTEGIGSISEPTKSVSSKQQTKSNTSKIVDGLKKSQEW